MKYSLSLLVSKHFHRAKTNADEVFVYYYRLAYGCLSPRQIYWEIKKYEKERVANQSTYWVIFELIWRDYFKFVGLKYGNRLFYRDGEQNLLLNSGGKWQINFENLQF